MGPATKDLKETTEEGRLTATVPMALAVRATAQDLLEAKLEPVKITAMEMATATDMAMTKDTEMQMVTGTVMETGKVTVTATGRATANP